MGDKSAVVEGSGIFESLFGGFSNGLSIFSNNPFRRKSEASGAVDALAVNKSDLFSTAVDSLTGEDTEGTRTKSNNSREKDVENSVALDEVTSLQEVGFGDLVIEEQTQSCLDVSERLEEGVATGTKGRLAEEPHDDVAGDHVKDVSASRKRKPSVVGDPNVNTEAGLHDVTSLDFKKKLRKKSSDVAQESEIVQSGRNSKKRLNGDLPESEARKGRKLENSDTNVRSTERVSQSRGKRPQSLSVGDENNKKRLRESESGSSTARKVKAEEVVMEATPGVETRSGSKRKIDSEMEELGGRKRQETLEKESLSVNGDESHGVVDSIERPTGKRKPGLKGDEKGEVKGQKKEKSSEETSESQNRLSRTIFVGNLPLNVKTKHLTREFSKFGPVESARLRSVPLVDTKLPRRAAVITGQLNQTRASLNGYVVFKHEESAKAALAHNMQLFNGKHLRVDRASAPRKAGSISEGGIEYDRARSIFVGNLPFDVEDEEVYSIFDSENPDLKVEAVRIVRDPKTSIGKGFAFVCFKKKVGATNALDNAEHIRLKNRQLRIIRFGFKSKQSRDNESYKLSARASTSKFRLKPRPGAEERLSRKGVFSYEGIRSSKADGKPGKGTNQAQLYHKGAPGKKRGLSKSSIVENKQPAKKRPAVAARKLASGAGKTEKRRREEKGTKLDDARKKKRIVK